MSSDDILEPPSVRKELEEMLKNQRVLEGVRLDHLYTIWYVTSTPFGMMRRKDHCGQYLWGSIWEAMWLRYSPRTSSTPGYLLVVEDCIGQTQQQERS